MVDTEWMGLAECRGEDPDLFFPDNKTPVHRVHQALSVCDRCLVTSECVAFRDLIGADHGIWGGQGRVPR